MPISLERHLELLSAAEDAMQGLTALVNLVKREGKLALDADPDDGPWKRALDNINLMGQVDFLLKRPHETRLTIAKERDYYSPTRIGINRRSRNAQARRRQQATQSRNNEEPNDDDQN